MGGCLHNPATEPEGRRLQPCFEYLVSLRSPYKPYPLYLRYIPPPHWAHAHTADPDPKIHVSHHRCLKNGPAGIGRCIFFSSSMCISTAQAHTIGTELIKFNTTYECVFVHRMTAGVSEMDVFSSLLFDL